MLIVNNTQTQNTKQNTSLNHVDDRVREIRPYTINNKYIPY